MGNVYVCMRYVRLKGAPFNLNGMFQKQNLKPIIATIYTATIVIIKQQYSMKFSDKDSIPFLSIQLIYNVVLVSAVQHSDSFIHIYIYVLFYILFHYGLSQNTEYRSLSYRAGPCYLPILYTQFAYVNPKPPLHSFPIPTPLLYGYGSNS